MIRETKVAELLVPLKERFAEKYGLTAPWRYRVERDERGNKEIFVRVNVNVEIDVPTVRDVRDTISEFLFAVPELYEYFPHVQFNDIRKLSEIEA